MFFSLWFIVPIALLATYLVFVTAVALYATCSIRGYFVALDQTGAWQHLIGVRQRWRHADFSGSPICAGKLASFERPGEQLRRE
jgi:hypothetical protein